MSITTGIAVKVALAAMASAMVLCSGCASLWSYQCSRDEIKRERIYASGNKEAIKAIRLGVDADTAIRAVALNDGAVGIGIDVSNWQALSKHPIRQIGAAILDAGMLYGTYEGVRSLNGSGGETSQDAGRDNNTITIKGDGNEVNVGDQSSGATTSQSSGE